MSSLHDIDAAHFADDGQGIAKKARYFGKYRAFVRDILDPQQRLRLRAFCPQVMGPQDDPAHWLPFADGCFVSGGGREVGHASVPQVGAGVWIEFECGDPEHPIWVGCWYGGADPDASEVPALAKGSGQTDASCTAPKGVAQAVPYLIDEAGEAQPDAAVVEPTSRYASRYGYNQVIKTQAGHVIEADDTPGEERLHIFHAAGSYFEIDAAGALAQKTYAHKQFCEGAHAQHDTGHTHVSDGPARRTVQGDTTTVQLGAVRELIQKEVRQYCKSDVLRDIVGDLRLTVGGKAVLQTGNDAQLASAGALAAASAGQSSLTTLENLLVRAANASGARAAIDLTALLGNVEIAAASGDVHLDSDVGSVVLSALIDAKIQAALVELNAQTSVKLTAPTIALAGAVALTTAAGVPVFSASDSQHPTLGPPATAEPSVKGQSLVAALQAFSAAVKLLASANSAGAVPLSPLCPAIDALAKAAEDALGSVKVG